MMQVDKYLDGKVILKQPSKGYRAGIDAVLLASAVHPKDNEHILDVGAGAGAVMLCLSYHHPNTWITGLEIQEEMVELNRYNIELNQKEQRLKTFQGSIANPPKELFPNSFHHVVSNPPYFDNGFEAKGKSRSLSRLETDINLTEWIETCIRMVRPRGFLTLIHRAERLDEILATLMTKMGAIKIYPFWPDESKAAKLVLIQARKSVKTDCTLMPGMVLHQEDHSYTNAADAIFRGNQTIEL